MKSRPIDNELDKLRFPDLYKITICNENFRRFAGNCEGLFRRGHYGCRVTQVLNEARGKRSTVNSESTVSQLPNEVRGETIIVMTVGTEFRFIPDWILKELVNQLCAAKFPYSKFVGRGNRHRGYLVCI